MDFEGAAAAARAMAPNGGIAPESYRTNAEKRKAERAAALVASLTRSMQGNELVQASRARPVTEEERKAWEDRAVRAQRAKEAQRSGKRAPVPKRAPKAPPKPSRLYSPEMSCDAARDVELSKGARVCLQLIHAVQRGRTPIIHRAWLADRLGVSVRQVQRYLHQLRECGYIVVTELRTAKNWMIGQIIRVTEAVQPFFRRAGWKKRRNPGETFLSHLQIASLSDSTCTQSRAQNPGGRQSVRTASTKGCGTVSECTLG